MDLTQQQVEAAKACGCTFVPASEAQVQRLAMQRRIFTLDGLAFVASRDGDDFLETHATLAQLIETYGQGRLPGARETVQEAAAADAATQHEITGERGAGGAQEVERHRAATRPRVAPRGTKRDG
jgi:hypothetical protein